MNMDRRTFLKRAGAATGLALLGGTAPSLVPDLAEAALHRQGATALGTMAYQLSWLENVQFAGSYIAERRGYYRKAGLSAVQLLPGGPTTSVEPLVASGKALVGSDSPDRAANVRAQGAPLKVIAACYQKSPYAILSLAKKPIRTPKEMVGKRIGLPAGDGPIWDAFLKLNKIDPTSITTVPVQSDPTPLATGEVDGWVAFVTNEPIVLELQGFAVHTFLLADFGYHLFADTYITTEQALRTERGKLKAFLIGEIEGWQVQAARPEIGVDLAVTSFGKGLGLSKHQQTLEAAAQNTLLADADTKAHGLLTMTEAKMAANVQTLAEGGIKTSVAELFDPSLLHEIFDGRTVL